MEITDRIYEICKYFATIKLRQPGTIKVGNYLASLMSSGSTYDKMKFDYYPTLEFPHSCKNVITLRYSDADMFIFLVDENLTIAISRINIISGPLFRTKKTLEELVIGIDKMCYIDFNRVSLRQLLFNSIRESHTNLYNNMGQTILKHGLSKNSTIHKLADDRSTAKELTNKSLDDAALKNLIDDEFFDIYQQCL